MIDITIGTIEIFIILGLIGIGPALLFLRQPLESCVAIAPVMGLVLTTLIGTYLIRFDYPIVTWAMAWTTFSITTSLIMCFYAQRTQLITRNKNSSLGLLFSGLAITSAFLIIPMIIGGLTFTVLRGNGVDAFNYIAMAGFLQHEPFSWASTASVEALLDKHPTYVLARDLLETRWSTSVILGWGSTLLKLPLQRFEYGFTILFFLMTYCCAFAFSRHLLLKARFVLLLSIAVAVGFWGQFVFDIRAMSHISALPILLFFLIQLFYTQEEGSTSTQQICMGMTLAAIAFLYVELVPLIILSLAVFFGLQLLQQRDTFSNRSLGQTTRYWLRNYWLVCFISVLLFIPIAHTYLLRFFEAQVSNAISVKNTWDIAYFQWLYKRPFIGVWGLSYLEATPIFIVKFFLKVLSLILSFLFLFGLFYSARKWKQNTVAINVCVAFLIGTFIVFTYLASQGQFWAAGKALSFGYPFLYFFIAITGLVSLSQVSGHKYLIMTGKYTVVIWLFIQCGLGFYRMYAANTQSDYPRYTAYHGEYRKHDWDIQTLSQALVDNKARSVGLLLSNQWLAEYLAYAWGWDFQVTNLAGTICRTQSTVMPGKPAISPEYLVVSTRYPGLDNKKIVARNQEIALIRNNH